jgi:hypothetical protein
MVGKVEESSLLEAVTRKRLVETGADCKELVCAVVFVMCGN